MQTLEKTNICDKFKSITVSISLSGLPPPRSRQTSHQLKYSRSLSHLSGKSERQTAPKELCSSSCSSLTLGDGFRSLSRGPPYDDDPEREFPMPSIQQAILDLATVLQNNTTQFQLEDHLDPEEIIKGQLWEEDEETLLDCVRDRMDDEHGMDAIWRSKRRIRQLKKGTQRERKKSTSGKCYMTPRMPVTGC